MKEVWENIPNYNGYQVSSLGNIRTYNKITCSKFHGTRHWKNRMIKQKISTNQYGRKDCRVELWNNGKHKTFLVARLVAFTFNKIPLDSELTVNHKDGNSLNNKIENLEIITRKENIQHAYKNNLYSNMIKIKIIDKNNNITKTFNCLNKANNYINRNHSYLSSKIKKNIFENDKYIWQII